MIWLISGLLLWVAAHFFKRALPGPREAMGKAGRGVVALAILAGIILMVVGYRSADYEHLYALPDWVRHVNNAAMLVAIFLLDIGRAKGIVRTKIRHPMLSGVVVWAAAHLLVNGDVASLVLFGGMGLWALAEMAVISRAEGPWTPPPPGTVAKDVKFAVIAAVLYALIVGIHYWFGFSAIAALA